MFFKRDLTGYFPIKFHRLWVANDGEPRRICINNKSLTVRAGPVCVVVDVVE